MRLLALPSLWAYQLTVLSLVAGGTVDFSNRQPPLRIDAPFYDASGVRVSGSDYLVQLYAGIDRDSLSPVGFAIPFRTGSFAGYFAGGTREIPFIEGGYYAWLQARAWQSAAGATFEEAAGRGAWTGVSNEIYIRTGRPYGGVPELPAAMIGLEYPGLPLVVREAAPQRGRVGGSTELSVVASTGVLGLYQWYEGSSGDTNSPIPGATSAVFTTPPLKTNTTFWVSVSNSAGLAKSAAVVVDVFPSEAVLLTLHITSGLPELIIDALPERTYRLHYTTNPVLTNWNRLVDLNFHTTPFTFIDESATNSASRFYRVLVP